MPRLLSLGARRSGSQFVDRHERRTPVTKVLAPMRDQVMAAWETVTLVLGDDSPLPETDAEVE